MRLIPFLRSNFWDYELTVLSVFGMLAVFRNTGALRFAAHNDKTEDWSLYSYVPEKFSIEFISNSSETHKARTTVGRMTLI
jgi:hypothetical protein